MAGAIYHWGIHGWAIYGLVAAQAATLAAGLPLALVLVALCYSTWKGLRATQTGRAS